MSAVRLLFVKLKHIGDALILTPTLAAARAAYPSAEIHVAVRKGTEGILAGCPAIDRIVTLAAPEKDARSFRDTRSDWRTARELRRQRFDYAFELTDGDRGRWAAYLSGASKRCVNISYYRLNFWWRRAFNTFSRSEWTTRHRVEKDFLTVNDCLPLGAEIPPLIFTKERTQPCDLTGRLGECAVIHPATRWSRKRWPAQKWIELGRGLLETFPNLVISAGPGVDETALAAELAAALGPRVFSTEGKLSWAQLAGLLYQARLFVGVDTAAMHLAAACQCPIVAIFGQSDAAQWSPWKARHSIVTAPEARLKELPPEKHTEAVETADVLEACRRILQES